MLTDSLEDLWNGLLDLTSKLVIPDWGALVNLLPIFLILGVVGPIATILAIAWVVYFLRKPRTLVRFEEGPVPALIGPGGRPEFPTAEPFCYRDALVYPAGSTLCDTCGDELTVICPKCGVTQSVVIEACGNCGLILRLQPRMRALAPAGPPSGGAASA